MCLGSMLVTNHHLSFGVWIHYTHGNFPCNHVFDSIKKNGFMQLSLQKFGRDQLDSGLWRYAREPH